MQYADLCLQQCNLPFAFNANELDASEIDYVEFILHRRLDQNTDVPRI
jgi:hypothetical protein